MSDTAATTSLTVTGVARVDRRTKDLVKRLQPGEIAVINHRDLDRVAGDGLAASGIGAVINAAPSISGRYPNGGPLSVTSAGIPIIDDVGTAVMDAVKDGDTLTIVDGVLSVDGDEVGRGEILDAVEVEHRMELARDAIGNELESFAINTLEYIEKEAKLLFEPISIPPMRTMVAGRHALIVVRGHDYKEDLRALKPYILEYHPVLIGVDGGADALLDMKFTPEIIIGDFDSLSERAWNCGAELIHHVHPDGRGPGREELLEKGLPYEEFIIEGTSEDAAMMLMYEMRAELIVAVGTHATMVEFLDKGRAGMSSTFLTRLRLGPMLIDAKGVSQLYRGRVRRRDILLLVASAITVILAVALVSDSLQLLLRTMWLDVRGLWYSLTGRFS
ncbi:MAG TPA: putative cytokinetic ring protein SteA [Microthrixaceae bacterium]|nr:putative cytokinetic ring protein SteA [Microthrixaceae bacterium]